MKLDDVEVVRRDARVVKGDADRLARSAASKFSPRYTVSDREADDRTRTRARVEPEARNRGVGRDDHRGGALADGQHCSRVSGPLMSGGASTSSSDRAFCRCAFPG